MTFANLWAFYELQSGEDQISFTKGIMMVKQWKHHWSYGMSMDGQILHATFFPRHVPREAYKDIMGVPRPQLEDWDWPTIDGDRNPLKTKIGEAESRSARCTMPMKGVRWTPLMALINRKVSPIGFLLLLSDGMTCSVCNSKRTFEQISMKAITTGLSEDPLVCLVCEGVQHILNQEEGKPENNIGKWVKEAQDNCAGRGVEFTPKTGQGKTSIMMEISIKECHNTS